MLCSETWSTKSNPSSCRMTSTPPERDTRRWVMLFRVYKHIFLFEVSDSGPHMLPWAYLEKDVEVFNGESDDTKTATVQGDSCHYLLKYSTLKSTKTFYCKVVITIIHMHSLYFQTISCI